MTTSLFNQYFSYGHGSVSYTRFFSITPHPKLNDCEKEIAFKIFGFLREEAKRQDLRITVIYEDEKRQDFELEYPSKYGPQLIELIEQYAKELLYPESRT